VQEKWWDKVHDQRPLIL